MAGEGSGGLRPRTSSFEICEVGQQRNRVEEFSVLTL
jgi:hypothetical protein